MAASLWSNVQVAIESAAATAVDITGITKANPGVVSWSTGTDPTNGDFVRLKNVQGMTQVADRIVKVANVNGAGNTFEISGENTTNYSTFSSGQFEVITFGTSLTVATGLSASGGEAQFVDITTIHDTVSKQIPGVASAAVYNFTCAWDPADAGLLALKSASITRTVKAIKFTFSGGAVVVFNGYISASLLPTGQAQGLVETAVSVTMFGAPSVY
jgi:hypothetical protein